jgi:hypothetical protein
MSESEGKGELTGLARSFHALFSGAAPRPEEIQREDQAAASRAEPRTPSSADTLVLPTLEEAGAAVTTDAADGPTAFEAPEPIDVGTPELARAAATPGVDEPAPTPEAPHQPPEDSAQPVPGPLDLAVEEHLVGVPAAEGEIRTLAAQLTESREIEPLARAVARLTIASGDPPDQKTLALAQELASPVVLGRIVRRIGSERDEERREEYFGMCRALGEDMAVAIRDELGDSTDRLARRIYRDALLSMGGVSRRVVEEMAQDENRFLVRHGVGILGEAGGDRAVELVTAALANPDPGVRREALLALVKLGDQEAGQLVIGLLDDTDQRVRMTAAVAAGELGVERALRGILAMLDGSKDPDEYPPLLRALGQLGDPGAVPSIEKHAVRSLFSKPRTDARIAAYQALSRIGTPHAEELLKKAIHDKEDEVREVVRGIMRARREQSE